MRFLKPTDEVLCSASLQVLHGGETEAPGTYKRRPWQGHKGPKPFTGHFPKTAGHLTSWERKGGHRKCLLCSWTKFPRPLESRDAVQHSQMQTHPVNEAPKHAAAFYAAAAVPAASYVSLATASAASPFRQRASRGQDATVIPCVCHSHGGCSVPSCGFQVFVLDTAGDSLMRKGAFWMAHALLFASFSSILVFAPRLSSITISQIL